ncbi:DegT/DnrJ/EryC1/StrS family aminotransferase [Neptunitalea lumnitzerae]|uniref:Aminotransferase n=1 Tax=Neptunitalea lumnitzerae TaxID=2965509 RepID=A0ABQ5MKS8_9FLAO|nr:DegT/DnrJ/EryC1/StrS family aminotransferase [Neptunitalea sp. Y10]GLB50009.1 aminotransferase [Neptunitalea sp. Y10]
MIKFLDLHAINARFEAAFQSSFKAFLDSGYYVLGTNVKDFENAFASYCGTNYCIGVGSGLDAIHLILEGYKLLGKLRDGDEVIVPANTYIATILAISRAGLTPILVEPDENTFNVDVTKVAKAVTAKTGAIMGVHLYGQLADMNALQHLASKHSVLLLEDAAQAHGAVDDKGNKAGNLSDAAAFSFYPTKNLGALGEAGAVTTNCKDLAATIGKLRNYGTSQKYVSDVKGYNARIDEVQCGFLNIKLSYLDADNERRIAIANRYLTEIENSKIELPYFSGKMDHVFHLFVIRTKEREKLKMYLEENGVQTLIHYPVPPHKQLAYAEFNGYEFPITEAIHNEVLSLPISPVMKDSEVSEVIKVVNSY